MTVTNLYTCFTCDMKWGDVIGVELSVFKGFFINNRYLRAVKDVRIIVLFILIFKL